MNSRLAEFILVTIGSSVPHGSSKLMAGIGETPAAFRGDAADLHGLYVLAYGSRSAPWVEGNVTDKFERKMRGV